MTRTPLHKVSRASKPKVRTGCTICKRRRIKCDETRPKCLNCAKHRVDCPGYPSLLVMKHPAGPGQTAWDSRTLDDNLTPSSSAIQPRLDPGNLNPHFVNAQEQRYFAEFVDMVKHPWVAAACHTDLWEASLPQVAWCDDTLRHAAVGIGALSLWHRHSRRASDATLQSKLPPAGSSKDDGTIHYFNALTSYGKALQLHAKTSSLRTSLFLSMLLLTFEVLRGNKSGALNHVNHGLALLLALVTDKKATSCINSLAPNPRPVLGAISDIYNHIAPQARRIWPDRVGSSAPPLANFQRGLTSSQHTVESFTLYASRLHPQTDMLERIPARFSTVEEAEVYIAAAQQRQHQLGAIVLGLAEESGILESNDPGDIHRVWSAVPHEARVAQFCKGTAKIANQLEASFLPLCEAILDDSSKYSQNVLIKALHLKLQCLELSTFEDPMPYVFLEHAQAHTPLFRTYVSAVQTTLEIIQKLTGSDNPAHRHSLQSSLAWRLFLVIFYCRDSTVREEALLLLREYPGNDGLWNARSLYALAARVSMVEVLNEGEGTPEEQWQRLQRREYIFENGGDGVVFRYLEKDILAGDGGWNLVEEAADVTAADLDGTMWKRQPLSFQGRLLMGGGSR